MPVAFASSWRLVSTGSSWGWVIIEELPISPLDSLKYEAWVDRLAWSLAGSELAFCTGRQVRVWDAFSVLQWGNSHAWVMRGFPGKVRRLVSDKASGMGAPLLAAAGGDISVGWDAWVRSGHSGAIGAMAFPPGTFLLASASEDGQVCLWHQVRQFAQLLEGAERGFSCLAWGAGGDKLAAGGRGGELLVWWKSNRPKGFARR